MILFILSLHFEIYSKFLVCILFNMYRENSPNSGCLLNTGNGLKSGPPLYSKGTGLEAAHQFIMGPKAA